MFAGTLRLWPYISLKLMELPSRSLDALRDPSKEPVLTAIVVVLALTLLFLLSTIIELLLVVLFPVRKKAEEEKGGIEAAERGSTGYEIAKSDARRRRFRLRIGPWWLMALATLAIFILASYATSQPRFCASCHAMSKSYSSWEKSPHRGVSCIDCHQRRGFFGYVIGKVDLWRMAAMQADGRTIDHIEASLDEEGCGQCHRAIYNRRIVSKSIRVSHAEFLSAGYLCIDCHGSIAHGDGAGVSRPTMDKCATCHDGRRATADCSSCHAKDVGVAVRRPTDDYPKAPLSSADCSGCHEMASCNACHGIEMPSTQLSRKNGSAISVTARDSAAIVITSRGIPRTGRTAIKPIDRPKRPA